MVRNMDTKQREQFDGRLRQLRDVPSRSNGDIPRRQPPPWWRGDTAAVESNVTAARQFGFSVGQVT